MHRDVSFRLVAAAASVVCCLLQPAVSQDEPDPLDVILNAWHQDSKQIERLEGEHRRFIYDYVNNIEKRAKGRFYYESPDKGRIDLLPDAEQQGMENPKPHPGKDGQQVTLTIQADTPERWVCDGDQILQIDEASKVVQQFKLPEQMKGQNIMDGPLPFLFGMEPEKAKARYQIQLISANNDAIDLRVIPRQQQDAANYQWARVRIERRTMLPMAVQILDPTGNRETVYTFPRIAKNPKLAALRDALLPWGGDPFKPNLRGYDVQLVDSEAPKEARPGQPLGPVPPVAGTQIPSVVGLSHQEAEQLLLRAGFTVSKVKGNPAINGDLVYRVEKQLPVAKTAAKPGDKVTLTLYMPMVAQAGAVQDAVPKVVGLAHEKAKEALVAEGYEVAFKRGQAATRKEDVYRVYEQIPAPGASLQAGGKVTLTVFMPPEE